MMECVCHFTPSSSKGKITETLSKLGTQEKVNDLLKYAKLWLDDTDKESERAVAQKIMSMSEDITEESCYHRACWLKFATHSRVSRATVSTSKRKVNLGRSKHFTQCEMYISINVK